MEAVSTQKSYLFLFIAIFGWGLSVPFVEFGLPYINPLPYLSYRFLLATAVMTPFIILYRMDDFKTLVTHPWTWIIGIAESLGLVLQYLGQAQGVPSGLAALLSLCFLLIVPFLSPLILGEHLKWQHGIAIFVGLFGIGAISTEGDLDNLIGGGISLLGIFLLLGAAFGYALYIVATSRLTTQEPIEVDTFTLFYIILAIVAVTSSLATLIFSTYQPVVKEVIGWLILLSIFSTLIAFFAYFQALKHISANTASVLLLLQVLVPFGIDYLFLGRRYGPWILGGASLIIVAMIIVVTIPFVEKRASM